MQRIAAAARQQQIPLEIPTTSGLPARPPLTTGADGNSYAVRFRPPCVQMEEQSRILDDLTDRNREVFKTLVETYLSNGAPIGSRTLSRDMETKVSAATIRNAMQDLEHFGLLQSAHASAGRVPTELGLRMFVDELLEVSDVPNEDRQRIASAAAHGGSEVSGILDRIGVILSRLTKSASLVLTPKSETPIKHVEFVSLAPDRAIVVLVMEDGSVENRFFVPPPGQTPSAMREAANFINAIVNGRTITELLETATREVEQHRNEIDSIAKRLVEKGLAVWETKSDPNERLIVRGRANLLEGTEASSDFERVRVLFDDLERKRDIVEFLELVDQGEGVRIFIGSENKLFSLSGSSLVISPYMDSGGKIVGALGVIGPTRLNYGRIVPIVDYTAQLVGRMVSEK